MKKPVALVIMDGYGFAEEGKGNAISLANTPNLDRLMSEYPMAKISASGEAVGLPEGQMGNSEVGHLNLGAGRIVYQSLTRVNLAVKQDKLKDIEAFKNAIKNVKEKNTKLHLFGLLSDGGVHSHIDHICAMVKFAKDQGVANVFVHAFLDGRDVGPKSACDYVKYLEDYMASISFGEIVTVSGRYYAMDRDKNWNRVQLAYDVITTGKGSKKDSATKGIEDSYSNGIVDEFVVPFVCSDSGLVEDNDSVIFANFRPDRAIEMATAISNPSVCDIDSSNGPSKIFFVSLMKYSKDVLGEVAFPLQKLDNTYGDYVSSKGLKQLRIAETEKYAHVTFFFDGGVDKDILGSSRVLVNSPKVATYDMQPEMSAYSVCESALTELDKDIHDTIILNFANCDMVGHTGVIPSTVKAVEAVDECVGKLVDAIIAKGGVVLLTADHGNAEKMLDENGGIFTAHTTNKVPFLVTLKDVELRDGGNLGDVAPTMLKLLELDVPKEMTGVSLIK